MTNDTKTTRDYLGTAAIPDCSLASSPRPLYSGTTTRRRRSSARRRCSPRFRRGSSSGRPSIDSGKPVIIGFDGSVGAQDALHLGLWAAEASHRPALVVDVHPDDIIPVLPGIGDDWLQQMKRDAQRNLAQARAMVPDRCTDAEYRAVLGTSAARGLDDLTTRENARARWSSPAGVDRCAASAAATPPTASSRAADGRRTGGARGGDHLADYVHTGTRPGAELSVGEPERPLQQWQRDHGHRANDGHHRDRHGDVVVGLGTAPWPRLPTPHRWRSRCRSAGSARDRGPLAAAPLPVREPGPALGRPWNEHCTGTA